VKGDVKVKNQHAPLDLGGEKILDRETKKNAKTRVRGGFQSRHREGRAYGKVGRRAASSRPLSRGSNPRGRSLQHKEGKT